MLCGAVSVEGGINKTTKAGCKRRMRYINESQANAACWGLQAAVDRQSSVHAISRAFKVKLTVILTSAELRGED